MQAVMRHKWLAAFSATAVLAVVSVAAGFWTGTGSGSGTAAAGSGSTVSLTATITSGISPGNSEPVAISATNASNTAIEVSNVHLDGIAVDSAHSACVTADFSMADVPQTALVAANSTQAIAPGTLVYADSGLNQDACKGATLTLTLSAT